VLINKVDILQKMMKHCYKLCVNFQDQF